MDNIIRDRINMKEKQNKTIKISIRITPEQYEQLQYESRLEFKTISELARERIIKTK